MDNVVFEGWKWGSPSPLTPVFTEGSWSWLSCFLIPSFVGLLLCCCVGFERQDLSMQSLAPTSLSDLPQLPKCWDDKNIHQAQQVYWSYWLPRSFRKVTSFFVIAARTEAKHREQLMRAAWEPLVRQRRPALWKMLAAARPRSPSFWGGRAGFSRTAPSFQTSPWLQLSGWTADVTVCPTCCWTVCRPGSSCSQGVGAQPVGIRCSQRLDQQSDGLGQAKMEVTWGLTRAVSSQPDKLRIETQACLGSSMPEAGFQATNAFTGENTLHLIGRLWFHY